MSAATQEARTARAHVLRVIFAFILIGMIAAALSPMRAQAAFRLSKSKKTLKYKKTYNLKAKGTSKKVKWWSSDKSIAKVKRTGKKTARVTAKKKSGVCYIYAKAGSKIVTCKITVTKSGKISKAYPTVDAARAHPYSGKIKGKWYGKSYVDKNGWALANTFAYIKGHFYYFNEAAQCVTGFFDLDGYSYWADLSGCLAVDSTPKMPNGDCYFFDKSGHMSKNEEHKINGFYYYYGADGIQVHNQWIGDKYYSTDGDRKINWSKAITTAASARNLLPYKYLYIGDARAAKSASKLGGKDTEVYFHSAAGATIDFFTNSMNSVEAVIPVIKAYASQVKHGTVLLELGENDLNNVDGYVGIYKLLKSTYPNLSFVFIDILPADPNSAKNVERAAFNARMKSALGTCTGKTTSVTSGCMEIYENVRTRSDFKTTDGTAYTDAFQAIVYKTIMNDILARNIKIDVDANGNWAFTPPAA